VYSEQPFITILFVHCFPMTYYTIVQSTTAATLFLILSSGIFIRKFQTTIQLQFHHLDVLHIPQLVTYSAVSNHAIFKRNDIPLPSGQNRRKNSLKECVFVNFKLVSSIPLFSNNIHSTQSIHALLPDGTVLLTVTQRRIDLIQTIFSLIYTSSSSVLTLLSSSAFHSPP